MEEPGLAALPNLERSIVNAPSRIGPYDVVGALGAGGMGEVYRARDSRLGRDVAVKVLPTAFAADPDRLSRFTREAQALASLNHPNIAAIYGVEQSSGDAADGPGQALVMEFVEGDDLAVLIARGPLPIEDAVPIARQIAEALESAHERGIIHRDLKPANVKVRKDGTVKVLDFGLAKAVWDTNSVDSTRHVSDSPTFTSPARTQPGMIMGTAAYMAPEQAKGRPVDRRADIWAFGVVLFEMLCGTRLFDRESTAETLVAVLTQEPDFAHLPANFPPRVVELLRRCLDRDPKKRLRDIGEARVVLGDPRLLEPAPRTAVSTVASGPASPPGVSRRMFLGSSAACAALGLAGGFAAARIGTRSAPAGAGPAALTITPLTSSGNVISAAVSPDGRYVAYVESEQGRQSLWLLQVADGQTLRLIPDQRVAYWSQVFSPDGNSIVFGLKAGGNVRGALYSISTLGGTPKQLVSDVDSIPTFSPDGRRMAFLRAAYPADGSTSLQVANADGTDARPLLSVKMPESIADIFFGAPAWSPDGATIVTAMQRRATTNGDAKAWLIQIPASGGPPKTLADPGWMAAAQAGWMPDGRSLLVIARGADQLNPQLWSVAFPSGQARPVTSDLNDRRIVSLTRDGRTLVTVAGIITSNVGVLPMDGSARLVRVSRSGLDGLRGLAFMPTGEVLYSASHSAFASTTFLGQGDGNSTFWKARPDGSDRTQVLAVANTTLSLPAVSSDGTVVHIARTRSSTELRAVAKDGTTRVLASEVFNDTVSVSNDGRVIVFSGLVDGERCLCAVGPEGGPLRRLTKGPAFRGSIDRTGRRVAYYYAHPEQGFRVGVASIDGGPLLADLPCDPPTVNSRIELRDEGVYLNTVPGDRSNVWWQPLDGRAATRVTSFDDQMLFDFAVSQDGKTLAVARGPRIRDAQMITGFAASPDGNG